MTFNGTFPSEIKHLGKKYFSQELGITPEEFNANQANLVGFFEILLRIDERIKKEQTIGKL